VVIFSGKLKQWKTPSRRKPGDSDKMGLRPLSVLIELQKYGAYARSSWQASHANRWIDDELG